MQSVSLTSASLATVCLQAPLYGIFLTLFAISMYCFLRHARKTFKGLRIPKRMLLFVGSVAMNCTITADFVITIIRAFQAFIYFRNGKNPELFYINLGHWTTTATQALTIATLAFGDMIFVYRIFIVYERQISVIVVPFITLWASIGSAIAESVKWSQFRRGEDIVAYVYSPIITATSSLTLINNCICSALILYRIWRSNAALTSAVVCGGGASQRAIMNVVQGAGLYVLWAVLLVVTASVQSYLTQTIWDTWAAATGVAFTLVSVHVLLAAEES